VVSTTLSTMMMRMTKATINEVIMLKNKKIDDKYDLTVVCPKYSLEK
jgi:hypothetical protein